MKKIFLPTVMTLLATLFIAVMPTDAECEIYEDTIRLHILAESDSEQDQAVKLQLRDAVLLEYSDMLVGYASQEEAEATLTEILPDIEEFATERLREWGCEERAEVTLGVEWYDIREYGEFALPAGYYTSLKIVIGEGAGKNWWCVMYPPLCLDASLADSSYTSAEKQLVSGKYKVKFKILSLISEISK